MWYMKCSHKGLTVIIANQHFPRKNNCLVWYEEFKACHVVLDFEVSTST